jgi:hypothetical protein
MNVAYTRLLRAAAASTLAAAGTLATTTFASANPPPDQGVGPWTVIASRELSVQCTQNGACPPQVVSYTTSEGVIWFDNEVLGSLNCGAGPRLQVSTATFPPSDSLNPLTINAAGDKTLTITSHCSGGLPIQSPSWTGVAKVWYHKDFPGGNTNSGGSPGPASGHTITGDVDLYDKPGGHGKKIGMLKKGDAVKLNGPCPIEGDGADKGWCRVDDTTQNKSGAVWGEFVSK